MYWWIVWSNIRNVTSSPKMSGAVSKLNQCLSVPEFCPGEAKMSLIIASGWNLFDFRRDFEANFQLLRWIIEIMANYLNSDLRIFLVVTFVITWESSRGTWFEIHLLVYKKRNESLSFGNWISKLTIWRKKFVNVSKVQKLKKKRLGLFILGKKRKSCLYTFLLHKMAAEKKKRSKKWNF